VPRPASRGAQAALIDRSPARYCALPHENPGAAGRDGLPLPKLVRKLAVARGSCHVIEHAIREDGTSPSHEFLVALKDKVWTADPDYETLPKDAQLGDYLLFLNDCNYLANHGYPERAKYVNVLDDGIWEFKHSKKRLSWYDTPGDGTYTPKAMIDRHEDAPPELRDHVAWWFPDMDRYIRLGHAFPKTGVMSGDLNIEATLAVREEDLTYDRQDAV